jgi:hypothetical protein
VSTNKFLPVIILFLILGLFSRGVRAEESNMDNPFGVLEFLHWNHSWNNYKYSCAEELDNAMALMQQAGVGWVRMDFLWEDIEPERGDFNFAKYDLIVETARRHNINILGILDYTAYWASPSRAWNSPSQDNSLFVNYASRVIERYKDRVKYWELWNEPDSNVYWQPQDGLKNYCVLLKEVYLAAKSIDPECKILNGGLANGLASVNKLYDNGAKDYFDILNIHIFENPLNPGSIKAVTACPRLAYKIMRRNGDGDKKIWISEIGCPGVKRGSGVKNWWMGKNPTERQQADWLKKVFSELLKDERAEKVFWAFFRDCDKHWDNGVDHFGIVRWDFSRKPAFKAFQKVSTSYFKD